VLAIHGVRHVVSQVPAGFGQMKNPPEAARGLSIFGGFGDYAENFGQLQERVDAPFNGVDDIFGMLPKHLMHRG